MEKDLLAVAPWPVYDEGKTVAKTVEIGVQVNGKVRGTVVIPNGLRKGKSVRDLQRQTKELLPSWKAKT